MFPQICCLHCYAHVQIDLLVFGIYPHCSEPILMNSEDVPKWTSSREMDKFQRNFICKYAKTNL